MPWLAAALATVLTLALALSACGSSSDSGGGASANASGGNSTTSSSDSATTGGGDASGVKVPEVSDADFQKTTQLAYGKALAPSDFPDVAVDAYKIASQPATPAEIDKVNACVKAASCDTGSGGELTLGLLEPAGGENTWRKLWRAVATMQAIRTPQIGKILYASGEQDLTKTLAAYRSLITQKANLIMGNMDFGDALLPLTKQAASQGILVAPTSQTIPSATGNGDIALDVASNLCQYGTDLATLAVKGKTSGTIALYTGAAGNPFGGAWEPCAERVVKQAGLELQKGNTNWTPQGETQAASALVASGKDIASVVYDYLPTNFFQKYVTLDRQPPTQAGGSASFATIPLIEQLEKKWPAWQFYQAPSQLTYASVGVTALVEKKLGADVPVHVVMPQPVVSTKEYLPYYEANRSLPATMEFGTLLPPEVAQTALAGS
ncbi:MAG TPA: substrate-binding domain-containing protein [Conexibacter sp.]